jgi:N-acetylgalactosamine 4-sulfate 6-O-sulfotransferase
MCLTPSQHKASPTPATRTPAGACACGCVAVACERMLCACDPLTLPTHFRRRNSSGLWCIPAFHIIGVSKCGTTDLYRRLALHPHVAKSHNKGPHFWDEGHSFDWYLRLYDVSSAAIAAAPGQVVVGDASSNTLTYSGVGVRNRRSGPERGGVTLPQVLAALQPTLRMVALLRNPTERLLSAFHYYRHYAVIHGATPAGFHAFAQAQLEAFASACPDGASRLECRQRGYSRAEQLTKGLYALFLPDFWASFPRNQLLVLSTELYGNATEASLARVLSHLELEKPPQEEWAAMLAARRSNTRAAGDAAARQMLPETRALLDDFYRPYNEELAKLLGDDSYKEWHTAR